MNNLRILREYQNQINVNVAEFLTTPGAQRGQIYSPTGSGKTECFGHTVHDLHKILNLIRGQNLNIAIVHPRIALSQEQLARFKSMFGGRFRFTSFHSGAHVYGDEARLETNTTSREDLMTIIDQETRSHITFSSYDSFHKIADIEFDLLILDEAHNLTQCQYFDALKMIAAKKALFYTATPINHQFDDGVESAGMNNEDLFGKIIARVDPKELIVKGYIVPPLVHLLHAETDKKGDDVETIDVVAESFDQQKKEMNRYRMPYVKMLVASRGLEDHRELESDLVGLWEKIGKMVPVYVIEAGDARKNGKTYLKGDRFAVLQEIKQSEEDCIVVHYDTLAEGIDISTLTGACILRKMSKAKLIQTIGRCGRPFLADLDDNFEVVSMEDRMKPISVITLPIVDGKHIGGMEAKDICEGFVDAGYGNLTTYLDEESKKTMSEGKDDFDFGVEDNNNLLAGVVDFRVERNASRLVELGFVL